MRYGHDQPEAPTHLGSHQLPLPPEWLPEGADDSIDPATSARGSGAPPARVVTERSVARPIMVSPRRARDAAKLEGTPPEGARIPPSLTPNERPSPGGLPRHPPIGREPTPALQAHLSSAREPGRDPGRDAGRDPGRDKSVQAQPRTQAPVPQAASPQPAREKSVQAPLPRQRESSVAAPVIPSVAAGASREKSVQAPLPRAVAREKTGAASRHSASAGASQASMRSASASASAKSASKSASASQPNPQVDAAAALQAMGALDPMQIPVPPELSAPIYSWVRRLALQADLAGADRVLRDALLELTSSLGVSVVYPGADGLWSLGPDDEIPRDSAPIIAVAQARHAIISSHTALIPVLTSTETVAVVLLTRNPRNPAYHPIEQVAMVAIARESAAILHHLTVAHLQKANEINADKGSLYRGEALQAHRSRGTEGAVIHLSPGWVRRAYPMIVITLLVAIVASIVVHVPTYSSSAAAVVSYEGTAVVAGSSGTLQDILVKPRQSVRKGQVIARLHSVAEAAELKAATAEYESLTQQYLFDASDLQVKAQLAQAKTRIDKAKASIEMRTVRAPKDGTIEDIRQRPGILVNPGDQLMTVVAPGTEPEVIVFLPGSDRPRIKEGMPIQIKIQGYQKTRETAVIRSVGAEIIGGNEAAKYIGPALADAMRLANTGGQYIIVHARLPGRTFHTEHNEYPYYHGMPIEVAEVKVNDKPFITTLMPWIDKYIPD